MNNNSDISLDLLYQAILCLETKEECAEFFNDLCTPLELRSISQRLLVAKLLGEGKVYSNIAAVTGASTATISRVNRTINSKYGGKGYEIVMDRLEELEWESGTDE
ncbi:MAG: TrpR-like protein, YerC/YecD [Oscillospiraceae bacterium]|nr:TrpR-like protein, YerC/YecD [Oscillospiraceae bacterium]